jgi:predicted RNase H-like HicB family nuclease
MRFLVRIYRTPTGYSAFVPDLPGCVAAAKTIEGTRKLLAKAIAMHLELMRQSGESIPAPTQRIEFAIDDAADEEFCTWVDADVSEPVSS